LKKVYTEEISNRFKSILSNQEEKDKETGSREFEELWEQADEGIE
jgi:hypothetical protein